MKVELTEIEDEKNKKSDIRDNYEIDDDILDDGKALKHINEILSQDIKRKNETSLLFFVSF